MAPSHSPAPPAADLPGDVAAAWAAMCGPVRERYAADGARGRARAFMLRWIEWEARRRGAGAAVGGHTLRPDARILAIRPDHLGDALLTTPALRLIKEALRTVDVTVLAGPWGADVPAHCPAVDRVRVCPFPGFSRVDTGGAVARLRRGIAGYGLLLSTAASLAAERYDLAINFRPDFWWGAALAALTAIPHRLGYATRETAPFLTRGLALERPLVGAGGRARPRRHAAEHSLALAREVLALARREPPAGFEAGMAYEPTPDERAEAWRLWRASDLDEAPAVVAIHPSPGEPAKRWHPEGFGAVADHLAGRYGARIVVTGGPADVDEAGRVARACRLKPLVLAGRTTFGVLAALLERCRFVLGTDNGALHLATARGVPTLRLFGPTDEQVWGAWRGDGCGAATGLSQDPSAPRLPTWELPQAGRQVAHQVRHWGSGGKAECAHGSPPAITVTSGRACAPCHRLDLPPWEVASGSAEPAYPCLQDIAVDRVIAAAEALWSQTSPPC